MLLGLYSWRTRAPGLMGFAGALLLISTLNPQALGGPLALKDEPVPGWPELLVEAHYVARIAMRGFCFPVPAGTPIPDTSLHSCARPDFWRGACDIYIDVEYMGSAELRAHEEKRCRGYDRQNDDFLADALRAWRERGENKYADMLDFESMLFVLEGSVSGLVADEESTR